MNIPVDLLYDKEHVWIRREGSDLRIGITDHAQSEFGTIVFAELPEAGELIERDEPFASLESDKNVSELYAPLSGTIVEVNEFLENKPELINESPYERAWMIVLEADDEDQLDTLFSAEEYEAFITKVNEEKQ